MKYAVILGALCVMVSLAATVAFAGLTGGVNTVVLPLGLVAGWATTSLGFGNVRRSRTR